MRRRIRRSSHLERPLGELLEERLLLQLELLLLPLDAHLPLLEQLLPRVEATLGQHARRLRLGCRTCERQALACKREWAEASLPAEGRWLSRACVCARARVCGGGACTACCEASTRLSPSSSWPRRVVSSCCIVLTDDCSA